MDANRYATKKTIAQGMLDIALLTVSDQLIIKLFIHATFHLINNCSLLIFSKANASQLKYILQVGNKHEFYTLMLTLISISIILQVSYMVILTYIGLFYRSI
jgi:hypothetical protein